MTRRAPTAYAGGHDLQISAIICSMKVTAVCQEITSCRDEAIDEGVATVVVVGKIAVASED